MLCHMQVSIGTLLAFTVVAISVLILRYYPPDEVPLPSSLQETIGSLSLDYAWNAQVIRKGKTKMVQSKDGTQPLLGKRQEAVDYPVIEEKKAQGSYNPR